MDHDRIARRCRAGLPLLRARRRHHLLLHRPGLAATSTILRPRFLLSKHLRVRGPERISRAIRGGSRPWQPRRFCDPRVDDITQFQGPVLQVDISGTDRATGEPFAVTAGSRAMNKTQGRTAPLTGVTNTANLQRFVLLAGDMPSTDLMDGVDTSWVGFAGGSEIDQVVRDVLPTV